MCAKLDNIPRAVSVILEMRSPLITQYESLMQTTIADFKTTNSIPTLEHDTHCIIIQGLLTKCTSQPKAELYIFLGVFYNV